MDKPSIAIEVVYALAERQKLLRLSVPVGTTVREAALRSGMQQFFPELDLQQAPLGIFGKALRHPDKEPLREGDRVEVYRPLQIDPKAARLERAKRQAKEQ